MQARQWHDWVAIPVHFILGGVVSHYLHAESGYSNATIARLVLVLTVEVISFVFHVWLVAGWCFATETTPRWLHNFREGGTNLEKWNKWKWLEYAFTATMGSVAVALKTYDSQPFGTVVAVVIVVSMLGILQQLDGYFVDMPYTVNRRYYLWAMATLGQGIEFVLVAAVLGVDPLSALFVVYATMRSAFVVIALFRTLTLENAFPTSSIVDWFDIDNTEALYSGFGWMAKLAIGGTTVADIVAPDTTTAVGATLAVAVPGVVLLATIAVTDRHKTQFRPLNNAL